MYLFAEIQLIYLRPGWRQVQLCLWSDGLVKYSGELCWISKLICIIYAGSRLHVVMASNQLLMGADLFYCTVLYSGIFCLVQTCFNVVWWNSGHLLLVPGAFRILMTGKDKIMSEIAIAGQPTYCANQFTAFGPFSEGLTLPHNRLPFFSRYSFRLCSPTHFALKIMFDKKVDDEVDCLDGDSRPMVR